ncbi:MAG: hypothetical protein R6X08_13305 [Desulfosalsimonadaceae bacterium]
MKEPEKNSLQRRCPRLGSKVGFSYCLSAGDGDGPCWKIFDCWWEIFDVEGYLREHLSAEAFERLRRKAEAPPRNKIASIIEIAEQAKKRRNR